MLFLDSSTCHCTADYRVKPRALHQTLDPSHRHCLWAPSSIFMLVFYLILRHCMLNPPFPPPQSYDPESSLVIPSLCIETTESFLHCVPCVIPSLQTTLSWYNTGQSLSDTRIYFRARNLIMHIRNHFQNYHNIYLLSLSSNFWLLIPRNIHLYPYF